MYRGKEVIIVDRYGVYDVDSADPDGHLVSRDGLEPEDVRQISELMITVGELRDVERKLAEVSRDYMQLNDTDMRALHFLIVSANQKLIATPGSIARHLDITTASTTKLLDRLERDGHITRSTHPTDRRALAIAVTAKTRAAAMATVGKQQARRFHAAARLTREERAVVIRFLRDMTKEIALTDDAWPRDADHG